MRDPAGGLAPDAPSIGANGAESSISPRVLTALARSFPTPDDAVREIAGLRAQLTLPPPVVHVISDVHGEHAKLRHVINNASGALRPLVRRLLGERLGEEGVRELLAVLYYPAEVIEHARAGWPDRSARIAWVLSTLRRQAILILALAGGRRRGELDALMPRTYAELLHELLAEAGAAASGAAGGGFSGGFSGGSGGSGGVGSGALGGSGGRPAGYVHAMVDALSRHDRDTLAVRAASRLIRNLTAGELIVAGDLGDRGPRIDLVIDYLMRQPHVSLLWGNHDAAWMGACLGDDACIATVLRFSARYRRAAQLEEGYGIMTTPLEKLAREVYGDDPCARFVPKGEGVREALTVARMQKAIAVIQFKAEGRLIRAHPEWNLEHRNLLHRIDRAAGTVTVDGRVYPLADAHLPTIDPADPYAYSPEEAACMELIRRSFTRSQRLWEHMSFLASHGGMWTRRDEVLIFHACVPVEKDGAPQALAVEGRERSGRELMDALGSIVRRAFRKGAARRDADADWLWYLWGGPRSPLFGKDKLATFEGYFIADEAAKKEHKNPYFELIHDAGFTRKIGALFGMGDDVLIVNGHVPVKVEKGEQPVKRGGNAVTIDGAFSEAYGDRGFTLILDPSRIALAEHHSLASVDEIITRGADIVPTMTDVRVHPRPRTLGDTLEGAALRQRIAELEALVAAYDEGVLAPGA